MKEIMPIQINYVSPIQEVHQLHPIPCMECGIIPILCQSIALHITAPYDFQLISIVVATYQ